jgi:hypothetical protein
MEEHSQSACGPLCAIPNGKKFHSISRCIKHPPKPKPSPLLSVPAPRAASASIHLLCILEFSGHTAAVPAF